MIVFLIQKMMSNITDPGRIGRMVQYQEKRDPSEWRVFHVRVREDVYEYWLDLRKLLKMSVSLILAYAVKKFLSKLLKIKTTDNYQFKNYLIVKEIINSVIVWKFIWGIPPNLDTLIRNEKMEIV